MRVTDGMRDAALLAVTTKSASAVYAEARRASTGLRVTTAADDPAAFARIAGADESTSRLAKRATTLDRAADDLGGAESALAQASELLRNAQEIAVAMADGIASPEDRAQAALEVAELRKALIGVANTKGPSGYLFAGSRTDTKPFADDGTFVGDDAALDVEVDDGVRLRGNASGARSFTAAGGRDPFADLEALEAALAADDPAAVAALLGPLDAGHGQLVHERGRVGLTMDRMRTSSSAASAAQQVFQLQRARDAEVDPTEAYTRLVQAQSAYERSLEVSRRLLATLSVEKMLP